MNVWRNVWPYNWRQLFSSEVRSKVWVRELSRILTNLKSAVRRLVRVRQTFKGLSNLHARWTEPQRLSACTLDRITKVQCMHVGQNHKGSVHQETSSRSPLFYNKMLILVLAKISTKAHQFNIFGCPTCKHFQVSSHTFKLKTFL